MTSTAELFNKEGMTILKHGGVTLHDNGETWPKDRYMVRDHTGFVTHDDLRGSVTDWLNKANKWKRS